jgi:hypothetical protein
LWCNDNLEWPKLVINNQIARMLCLADKLLVAADEVIEW